MKIYQNVLAGTLLVEDEGGIAPFTISAQEQEKKRRGYSTFAELFPDGTEGFLTHSKDEFPEDEPFESFELIEDTEAELQEAP